MWIHINNLLKVTPFLCGLIWMILTVMMFKNKNWKTNFITLCLIGAEVIVEIHKRYLLQCSASTNSENVRHIAWYHCRTADCRDKFLIAHVQNMRVAYVVNPSFDIHISGALVIKKILPVDDGKLFICMTLKNLIGIEMSTTILKIAKGDVYISVIQWW